MENALRKHPHPGPKRTCKICLAAYQRKYRRTAVVTPQNRIKQNARAYANSYLRRGKIERKPCFICNTTHNLQFHHEDYDRPLMTISICRLHHTLISRGRLCLIPSAVKAFWDYERSSRAVMNAIAIDRTVQRIKKACGQIKILAQQS